MARTKARTPMKREASNGWIDLRQTTPEQELKSAQNGAPLIQKDEQSNRSVAEALTPPKSTSITELLICVAGIYASFLSWAFLQERITTTSYGPPAAPEVFTFSIFLNTVQSAFAFLIGYAYLFFSSRSSSTRPPIFPSRSILLPLILVSVTSSLASPFGYASLKHVGYITFILAKSCKLLPVMALHISIFRKRYPLYKYAVVALVTAGVAIFTLQTSSKQSSKPTTGNVSWGIFLLSINLLFDGLTNSTQDYINGAFAPYSGSQMMCAQNLISTLLTSSYLLSAPYLASNPLITSLLPISIPTSASSELSSALTFITKYPAVGTDVLSFAACGAIGQVFIFYMLARFSSLALVTVTVTRKMITMLLSVLWFGHTLTNGQYLGVVLVFGGVVAEAVVGRWEKGKKKREMDGKSKKVS